MRILSIEELKPVKGINYSRPHIYRLIKARQFVQPIKVGQNRIGFVEEEVDAWIRRKIAERDAGSGEAV